MLTKMLPKKPFPLTLTASDASGCSSLLRSHERQSSLCRWSGPRSAPTDRKRIVRPGEAEGNEEGIARRGVAKSEFVRRSVRVGLTDCATR
eukprot:COSAG06_NODE_8188_length_2244_cov_935.366434_1_plen_90_part_10